MSSAVLDKYVFVFVREDKGGEMSVRCKFMLNNQRIET